MYPREVETQRLLLRQFREQDFEPYLRIVTNPDVHRAALGADAPTPDDTLGVDHVSSLIHPDNVASRRVAEKLGGKLEKTHTLGDEELVYYGYTSAPP